MMRRIATSLLRVGTHGAASRFRAAMQDPAAAQVARLRALMGANADCRYGRAHGFASIDTLAAFQARVPIVGYDELAPYVEAIRAGEASVLTTAPVLMLEKSSGSTQAAKYIPYTAALRSEFQAATSAWLNNLYTQRPALCGRGAYWSISPVSRERETTPGGLPVGFEDDTAYFDPVERWVLNQLLSVPAAVANLPDVATCRYVTLRHLLDGDGPGLISVWNPTFLTLLVEAAGAERERLLHDLRAGTLTPPVPLASALQRSLSAGLRARPARAAQLAAGDWSGSALFPHLVLISCWADAAAASFVPSLMALFPGVEVQGKGLLATEGVTTIPLLGKRGGVPALTSHFLEFVPAHDLGARPLLAHQLELEGRYEVLLTTGGGFYRYALRDVVEVVGFTGPVPHLQFVGKAGLVSDLVGEKLNAVHVGAAIAALNLSGTFAMLAPEANAYVLYTDTPPADLGRLESKLRENPHYAYARDLMQLGPVRCLQVGPDAAARYVDGCVTLGQRAGDVKPTPLHKAPGWRGRLT